MNTRVLCLLTAAGLALLAACGKQPSLREIDWAKAALARNPAYEIVATDEAAGIFTVRDTATGIVHTLRLEDLIATPRPVRVAQPAAPVVAPEPASAPAEPEPASEPTLAANQTTAPAEVVAGSGASLAAGPGYSITRGEDAPLQPAKPAGEALEGPGYSITRHDSPRAAAAPAETVANVEKRTDPIICQGDRLMRIDGEQLEFTGDAVIAEKGCDLFISNANIRAGGIGIIARQARVHIVNSTIGGTRASYEASEGAEIYVARSTFNGIGRRFDNARMNDLGGNAYQAN